MQLSTVSPAPRCPLPPPWQAVCQSARTQLKRREETEKQKEASRSWVPEQLDSSALGAVSGCDSFSFSVSFSCFDCRLLWLLLGIFCLWPCVLGRKWSGRKQRQLLPMHARIFKIQIRGDREVGVNGKCSLRHIFAPRISRFSLSNPVRSALVYFPNYLTTLIVFVYKKKLSKKPQLNTLGISWESLLTLTLSLCLSLLLSFFALISITILLTEICFAQQYVFFSVADVVTFLIDRALTSHIVCISPS